MRQIEHDAEQALFSGTSVGERLWTLVYAIVAVALFIPIYLLIMSVSAGAGRADEYLRSIGALVPDAAKWLVAILGGGALLSAPSPGWLRSGTTVESTITATTSAPAEVAPRSMAVQGSTVLPTVSNLVSNPPPGTP